MTSENCNTKNPLVRDGVSRNQRFLPALHPHYARIDERTTADFLVYARRYGESLQYYDGMNRTDGDWTAFFTKDVAATVAAVAKWELEPVQMLLQDLTREAEAKTTWNSLKITGAFETAFYTLFALTGECNRWLASAAPGQPFTLDLQRVVASQLSPLLPPALSAFKYAQDLEWFDITDPAEPEWANWVSRGKAALQQPLSATWFEGSSNTYSNLQAWLDDLPKDPDILEGLSKDLADLEEELKDPDFEPTDPVILELYRRILASLVGWVDTFLQGVSQVVHAAPAYLHTAVRHYDNHTPHMALYLAFIRLFQYAQVHLNGLTGRHLDFYYRRVLDFSPKPAVADRVHVLFEPAKNVDKHLIPAGTALKAGRDAEGKLVTYTTHADTVINKAVIAELGDIKTVTIDKNDGWRIYSAPVANSADGKGAEFQTPEPKWKPFGETQLLPEGQQTSESKYRAAEFRTMDFAQVGFAVSSHLLDLKEGTRTLHLTFEGPAGTSIPALTPDDFIVRLTGEKGWIEGAADSFTPVTNGLKVTVTLDASAPPVFPFNAEIHTDRNYGSGRPLMEFILRNEPDQPYLYESLKDIVFTRVKLEVEVTEARAVVVQSDMGKLDVNKPFQPFGSQPVKGSSFYLGSPEAFRKPLTELKLRYHWLDAPGNFATHYSVYNADLGGTVFHNNAFTMGVSVLQDKEWTPVLASQDLFPAPTNSGQQTITLNLTGKVASRPGLASFNQYSKDLTQGFVRWELKTPSRAFGHKQFPRSFAKAAVGLSDSPPSTLPNDPYTPVMESLEVDYKAQETVFFNEAPDETTMQAFHITPFGTQDLRPAEDAAHPLLPLFQTGTGTDVLQNEGELYLGVSRVDLPQMVTLLFQVAEGSADPELPKKENHIRWSVLTEEGWLILDKKNLVGDTSNDLNASGILSVIFPREASLKTTQLPAGKVWLRGSVKEFAGAVCDVLDVKAQALTAGFTDAGNDPRFLAKPLPAGSIGKLIVKQAAVKSVKQPYASFGGKTEESQRSFHTRVSERLRHKDRAITIWDYEKMVLEAFPNIYKVKCINHSTYVYKEDGFDIQASEFAPGFVTVIAVPDLTNQNAVNPLEPRVSLNTLDEIKKYLQKRMSPFAARRLQVLNPLYESLQVEVDVSLREGYDPDLYEEMLNKDIMEFLSPWAFPSVEGGDNTFAKNTSAKNSFANNTFANITFGGKMHRSTLVNFVEERPYVDYITEFKLHHYVPSESGVEKRPNVDEALATSARSIFVSHTEHLILSGVTC